MMDTERMNLLAEESRYHWEQIKCCREELDRLYDEVQTLSHPRMVELARAITMHSQRMVECDEEYEELLLEDT